MISVYLLLDYIIMVNPLVSVCSELACVGNLVEELLWNRSHDVFILVEGRDVRVLSLFREIFGVQSASTF